MEENIEIFVDIINLLKKIDNGLYNKNTILTSLPPQKHPDMVLSEEINTVIKKIETVIKSKKSKNEVWQEFVEEVEKYGWYLVTPDKEKVDIRCKGKEYNHFPFKYDEFITHDDFPLRYYKRKGVLFCNTNDIDAFPTVIDCEIPTERMMMIIKALHKED